MRVYLLLYDGYDGQSVIAVFGSHEDALRAAADYPADTAVEEHDVIGAALWQDRQERERIEDERREREARERKEDQRIAELKRLNSTPHTWPRNYRPAHRPSREQIDQMRENDLNPKT